MLNNLTNTGKYLVYGLFGVVAGLITVIAVFYFFFYDHGGVEYVPNPNDDYCIIMCPDD